MGHCFHILGLAQDPWFGVLSESEGLARVLVRTKFELFMSFEKACSSAVVVHARTSILAAKELAHFSARWDEWILLTAREQEGVFLF
jgi:hypothetical protein